MSSTSREEEDRRASREISRLQETNWKAQLGARITALRGAIPKEVLAVRAQMSSRTLNKLEKGLSDPQLGTLLRLMAALNISSVEKFMGDIPSEKLLR